MKIVASPIVEANSEIVVLATDPPKGRIERHVKYHVEAWSKAGFKVVLVLGIAEPGSRSVKTPMDGIEGVLARPTVGFHFGAWADAFRSFPSLWNARRLLLLSDALLGPVSNLASLIDKIRSSSADIVRLTDVPPPGFDFPTNFVGLQTGALRSEQLRNFWSEIVSVQNPQAAFQHYEPPFRSICRSAGLTEEVIFPLWLANDGRDPVHSRWRDLLAVGFPYVRADLLHAHASDDQLSGWRDFFKDPGLLGAIDEHLRVWSRQQKAQGIANGEVTSKSSVAALFNSFQDATTGTWLASPATAKYRSTTRPLLADLIQKLEAKPPAVCKEILDLRLLMTINTLFRASGTESWVRDIALALAGKGVPIALYSRWIDEKVQIVKDLRARNILVTTDFDDAVRFCPSVIHLQHAPSMQETERLGTVPVINMTHGLLPRGESARLHGVDAYAAVSAFGAIKLHHLTKVPVDEIAVLPNPVDGTRFAWRAPRRNRKAMLFAYRAQPADVAGIEELARRAGYTLTFEKWTQAPELVLPEYELVFAVGRSALEALACGCRVVLFDDGFLGPAITSMNFTECYWLNFALVSGYHVVQHWRAPYAADYLIDQITAVDDNSAISVSSLARSRCSIEQTVERLMCLYELARMKRHGQGSRGH